MTIASHEAACCDDKSDDIVFRNPGSCPGLTVTNVHEDQDACTMMKTNCMETSKQTDILQAFARMRSQSWQI